MHGLNIFFNEIGYTTPCVGTIHLTKSYRCPRAVFGSQITRTVTCCHECYRVAAVPGCRAREACPSAAPLLYATCLDCTSDFS